MFPFVTFEEAKNVHLLGVVAVFFNFFFFYSSIFKS